MSTSRSSRRRIIAAAVAVVVGILTPIAVISTRSAGATSTFNVLTYGAIPNGIADNTAAFQNAIAAAQSAGDGNEVYVPPGVYAFTAILSGSPAASVRLLTPPHPSTNSGAVALVGAGSGTTELVEHVPGQALLAIKADGSSVSGLTLNGRSFNGGPTLTVQANNTSVHDDTVLGATKKVVIGSGLETPFAMYYVGPAAATQNAPSYEVGNNVANVTVVDGINNDGFSYSFQSNSSITNVHHYGSRLALFVDSNVTVTHYFYTPNTVDCFGATQGFYVTNPSTNLTISDFETSGSGGVVGGPADTHHSTGIHIDAEKFTGSYGVTLPSNNHLSIGNAQVDITGTDFTGGASGSISSILVQPPSTASITVENSTVPQVVLSNYNGNAYSSVSLTFTGDVFPAERYPKVVGATFFEQASSPSNVGPGTVSVSGGTWNHQPTCSHSGTTVTSCVTQFTFNNVTGFP